MILIVGGGNLSGYLCRRLSERLVPCDIASSSCPTREEFRLKPDLVGLDQIIVPEDTRVVVITWSHTCVRNHREVYESLRAVNEIVKFAKAHPSLKFVYFSSSVASLKFARRSFYAASKLLIECLLSKLVLNPLIIVRPGLIYGLEKCPIKTLYTMWSKAILVVPGRMNASFSVTSASSILELLVALLDDLTWSKLEEKVSLNYCEPSGFSLGEAYRLFSLRSKLKIKINPLRIGSANIFYRILWAIGLTKIDLSLSEVDRVVVCSPAARGLMKKGGINLYIDQVLSDMFH